MAFKDLDSKIKLTKDQLLLKTFEYIGIILAVWIPCGDIFIGVAANGIQILSGGNFYLLALNIMEAMFGVTVVLMLRNVYRKYICEE